MSRTDIMTRPDADHRLAYLPRALRALWPVPCIGARRDGRATRPICEWHGHRRRKRTACCLSDRMRQPKLDPYVHLLSSAHERGSRRPKGVPNGRPHTTREARCLEKTPDQAPKNRGPRARQQARRSVHHTRRSARRRHPMPSAPRRSRKPARAPSQHGYPTLLLDGSWQHQRETHCHRQWRRRHGCR